MQILLSNSQAGLGRTVKQEQDEISRNHVQTFSGGSVYLGKLLDNITTEPQEKVCAWLREIYSCSCLAVLPGHAWLLLNKICILFPGPL